MVVTFEDLFSPQIVSNQQRCIAARDVGHCFFRRISNGDETLGFKDGDVYLLKDEMLTNLRNPRSWERWGNIQNKFIPFYGSININP